MRHRTFGGGFRDRHTAKIALLPHSKLPVGGLLSMPPGMVLHLSPILFTALLLSSVPVLAESAAVSAQAKVDFNHHIRPIISAKCFHCHGPDEESRKAKLRLDHREEALKDRDGFRAIVPGDLDASELILRITSHDKDEVMPPPKEGDALTAAEIDLLKRWVAQGAEYQEHWAWSRPALPPVPAATDAKAMIRNPVDAFISNAANRAGLRQSPEADRHTLLRRLSLDLIGLPPTPEEVAAFVGDATPDAYEKAVDRLLASPHFGEKWARMWLDLARYADSTGYGSDQFRLNIWPYRDWVINAFNRNLPYDQFTIEQLAGDLLPNATPEQIAATAFHRNTMTNVEGGTIDEEFRVAAVKDRVATTTPGVDGAHLAVRAMPHAQVRSDLARGVLPVLRVFNQTEDSDREDESADDAFPTEEEKTRRDAVQREIAALKAEAERRQPGAGGRAGTPEAQMAAPVEWTVLEPERMERRRRRAAHTAAGWRGAGDRATAATEYLSHPRCARSSRASQPFAWKRCRIQPAGRAPAARFKGMRCSASSASRRNPRLHPCAAASFRVEARSTGSFPRRGAGFPRRREPCQQGHRDPVQHGLRRAGAARDRWEDGRQLPRRLGDARRAIRIPGGRSTSARDGRSIASRSGTAPRGACRSGWSNSRVRVLDAARKTLAELPIETAPNPQANSAPAGSAR